MPSLKAIRRRISSVENTMQITRAMKLVATAKLRRAQEAAVGGRSMSEKLGRVLSRVVLDLPPEFSHPLLEPHEQVLVRRVIAVAADRGLCGSFNVAVYKSFREQLETGGAKVEVLALGRKIESISKQRGLEVIREYETLGEDISRWPLAGAAEMIMEDYSEGRCDEVVLYYTKFNSISNQEVVSERLLPLALEDHQPGEENLELLRGMGRYDPAPEEILAYLLPLLVTTKLRQAALDSKASEHAARMRAMDSATKNAGELIDKLRLFYNRARQRAITSELIDIVGGAEALK